MFRKSLICFFLFLEVGLLPYSFAQQVIIQGNIPHAIGKQIQAIGYADMLTFTEKQSAITTIDSTGNFKLTFNTYFTIPVILKMEFHSVMFYVEPNKTYTLAIKPINFDSIYRVVNTSLSLQIIDFVFTQTDTTDINTQMLAFDTLYDNFAVDNYYTHARQTEIKPIKQFIKKTDSLFAGVKNEYFKDYIKYRIASLKLLSQAYSKNELIGEYILPIQPLYFNSAYMQFFNDVFTGYLGTGYSKISKQDLKTGINFRVNYLGLLDTLGKDTMLRNEVIRELVLLKTLKDLNTSKEFNKQNIYGHIAEMARLTKFEQHRIIATNLMASFSKMFPGTPAPDFLIKDIKTQKQVGAKDFIGKNICLFFWKSNCIECVNEIAFIDSIAIHLKEKVVVLPVNIDYVVKDFNIFCKKNKYVTTLYYWDKNFSLLNNFNVMEVPLVIIIDKENTLVKALGPLPSNGLEKYLLKMVNSQ